ncbi:MAG TPA: sulfurtransferase, partial [Casimicrobium sp.]|nr:sulfurtransferase [Casimicrobium sp.]
GGIRCEKAAPFLQGLGVKNVYQLEGGILRYFEQIGRDHYTGDCFVFDERRAVDASLAANPS